MSHDLYVSLVCPYSRARSKNCPEGLFTRGRGITGASPPLDCPIRLLLRTETSPGLHSLGCVRSVLDGSCACTGACTSASSAAYWYPCTALIMSLTPLLEYGRPGMRTSPPGEVRAEGEGKKPMVVGEPGGLG